MNLCNNDHDEVCYEGHVCPMCEKIKGLKELEEEIDSLKDEIQELGDRE